MNTVRRFSDPHNPWWRYLVSVDGAIFGTPLPHEMPHEKVFANAQAAQNFIEQHFPGLSFSWDTRDPQWLADEEARAIDRYEDAKNDAREDARLEREGE
jgi:hypothetical protein